MTQLLAPNDIAASHAEDDFEVVDSQAHEIDDLSSLTSTHGETDNESEGAYDDSQAQSNITLQMPSIASFSEYMDQSPKIATAGSEPDVRQDYLQDGDLFVHRPALREPVATFDIKAKDFINLPILYFGPEEHKLIVVEKLAAELHEQFTDDVWQSERYTIAGDAKHGGLKLIPQSRISLQLIGDLEEMKSIGRPFLIIDLGSRTAVAAGSIEKAIEDYQKADVPYLPLLINVNWAKVVGAGECSKPFLSLMDHGTGRRRLLKVSEFAMFQSEQLSIGVMHCLDTWAAVTNAPSPDEPKYPSISQIAKWLIVLMAMAYCIMRTGYSADSGIAASANSSSSAITFHQITETTALIEIPFRYRNQPRSKMPEIAATVSRDGKLVNSQLQLVVDNLYALDWPLSEAHGELVVAAETKRIKKPLSGAYSVQYSTKTPLLNILTEKLRGLQNLGHLAPDVDFGRKSQEILRQLEDSRSYVVKASSERLASIKKGGSSGLKKLQEDYSHLAQGSSEKLRQLMLKGSKWSKKVNRAAQKIGGRRIRSAHKGLQKLHDMPTSLPGFLKPNNFRMTDAANPFTGTKKSKNRK